MKKILLSLIIALSFLISACTDEEGAIKVLRQNNYKPLSIDGYGWFNGGKEDLYRTKFTAIAPNGDTVKGCVTKGIFKGSTIRLND